MMAFRLLLSCVLLTSGFSGEIPVFVQTGSSVQLDIQAHELLEFEDLYWTYNTSENIIKYSNESKKVTIHKDSIIKYFNNITFSLTLKNLQKTDSGLYRAKTVGRFENIIVTYKISVIDAVEAPVLAVNSSWSSPDPCTFTCKGNNISISSIYNSSSCSQEESTSSDIYILRLNCSSDSIICNYSNPVSWKTDAKKINELCTVHHDNQGIIQPKEASLYLLCLIPICLVLTTGLVVVGKKKKGAQETEQSIYAEVGENIKLEKTLEKSEDTQTLYDTARDPGNIDVTIHTTPINQCESLTEKGKPDAPCTIYCTVQPRKPSITEAEKTVYALVNKPPVEYDSAHPQSE